MPFCSNCGVQLANGAKFCQKCGFPVQNAGGNDTTQRTEYAGKIFKCPNCGEIMDSFEAVCPACGYELRDAKASSAVKEFAMKLEAIEAKREPERRGGIFAALNSKTTISKTDEQKINLIQNFPIPNSKEDIIEFLILATSNVNYRLFDSSHSNASKGEVAVNDAWVSKIKQVYGKAKMLYRANRESKDYQDIKTLYDNFKRDVHIAKRNGVLKTASSLILVPILIIIFAIIIAYSNAHESKHIKELESITVSVEDAIENKDFKLALKLADSIDYHGTDKSQERKWDAEREYWVDIVLEEAEKNGIILEYTPTEDIDNANESEETEWDLLTGNDSEADKE